MRVLMDTHAFLWYVCDDPKLSETCAKLIEDRRNDKYVSIASIWEIAIKVSTGKLELNRELERHVPELVYGNGFEVLRIEPTHLVEVSRLAFHHKDPFDRLLIAQSLVEEMPIISVDATLDDYDIERLW